MVKGGICSSYTTCFYVRYDAVKFKDGMVNIEKIGKVKYN